MCYLSKLKKVRTSENGKWRNSTTVAYVADIAKALCIVS